MSDLVIVVISFSPWIVSFLVMNFWTHKGDKQ